MPVWFSTSLVVAGWLMMSVALAFWSIPVGFTVSGAMLIWAGVMAE
jgi:hypothetical protein